MMDYRNAQKQVITIAIITAIMLLIALALTSCGTLKEPIEMRDTYGTLEKVEPVERAARPDHLGFTYRGDDKLLYYFVYPADKPYQIGERKSMTTKL